MKPVVIFLAIALYSTLAMGQEITCNSSTMGGVSTTSCRAPDGYYSGITCDHGTCTAESGSRSGNVYVESLVGVPLESGDCDQACKDRLRHREEVTIKKAALMRAIAAKHCTAPVCSDGELVAIYRSLSYCEAHRLSVEDERKYCSKEVVNDGFRALLDAATGE